MMKYVMEWRQILALWLWFVLMGILKEKNIPFESCPANCRSPTGCNDADRGCSECKEGWFGRQCNYPLECYTGRGLRYSGTKTETSINITCQAWSQQTPQPHSLTGLDDQRNYCRNPNPAAGDQAPWCYQMTGARWNYCGVPKCDTQCPAPNLLVFGDVINPPPSGFGAGFVVEVVTGDCGPGSRGKMTCQQDLTWSTGFDCTEIPGWCTKPIVPEPSYIADNRDDFYYQNQTTVLCRAGYEIVGNDQITCLEDKSWSQIPQCTRVKCQNPSLNQNSQISGNGKSTYQYEDEITVVCYPGYDVIGQTTLKCQANKQWSDEMPTCKVVECSQPNLNENSYVLNNKTTYIYLDQINIGCHIGYTITGIASSTCRADKSWSGTFPTCEPVPCNNPSLPSNTEVTSPQNFYVYKDEVSLTCVKGYELKDRNRITCLANGTWSTIPECTVVKCKESGLPVFLMILENNKTEYQYLDTVTLGCKGNYEFNGTNTTTCLHTGQWKQINAECIGYPINPEKRSVNDEESNVGSIVGGVIGAVVVMGIVILIVIIYVRRRRDRRCKYNEESQLHTRNDESLQAKKNQPVSGQIYENTLKGEEYANFTAISEEKNEESDDNIYYNASIDDKSTCIKIEDLANYVREKAMDPAFFANEFSLIETGLHRSADEACKPKNKAKNKYKSIYPYDDNRVILTKTPSNPESDFINASQIKGYDGKTKYIAAQGPQKMTEVDFWRMIWELNCCRIVMLTNVFEDGKQKCEQYWPDKGKVKMGTITIEHCNTDAYAEFTVRQLSILKDGSRRSINHFHFTAWPDKSVPSYVYSLAQFRRKVFSTPDHNDGPLVVHCSAGVGRTGTFIALDYLVDEAKAVGTVDVFSCLKKLREQRVNMVQTKEQYSFLHKVLVEDYECEVSKIPSSEFISRYEHLQMVNLATGMTHLDERYQALEKASPVLPFEEFEGGRRPAIKDKNRYSNILPVDSHRPFLTGSGEQNGDYINAVYFPTYRDKNAFIATQMPLQNTVLDFWTLVYEQDVSAIIMLNSTSDKSCGVYWCDNEHPDKTFGPFNVSFVGTQTDNSVIIRTLTVEKKPDKPRTVKQFALTDWPDGQNVPSSPSSLLHLMDKVQACQSGKQGKPVVVHCMNGADKSGLFCTVVAVIDRLKVEHDVVIQQIITQLRSRRPQCIPNKEQFQYCYKTVHQYLLSFETYSNFS